MCRGSSLNAKQFWGPPTLKKGMENGNLVQPDEGAMPFQDGAKVALAVNTILVWSVEKRGASWLLSFGDLRGPRSERPPSQKMNEDEGEIEKCS